MTDDEIEEIENAAGVTSLELTGRALAKILVTTLRRELGGELHVPRRGDAIEAWLKQKRDEYPPTDEEWTGLDGLLDDYRLAADTGEVLRAPQQ